jgi:hypothetical protein
MIIPGGFAISYGSRLLKVKSKENIKGSIGALSIIGVFLLATIIRDLLPVPGEYKGVLRIVIATLLVIPIYLVLTKYAIQATIREKIGCRDLIGKNTLLILLIEVYYVLYEIVDRYAPIKEGYDYIKESPWDLLGYVGPLVAAWAFYKIASKFIRRDNTENGASSDAAASQE